VASMQSLSTLEAAVKTATALATGGSNDPISF
jgi:hypothetical protein